MKDWRELPLEEAEKALTLKHVLDSYTNTGIVSLGDLRLIAAIKRADEVRKMIADHRNNIMTTVQIDFLHFGAVTNMLDSYLSAFDDAGFKDLDHPKSTVPKIGQEW